jgi:glycine cleavage system aminomethyltransferase T
VTSARRSAAAGSVVGLAWVPAAWAVDGHRFEIRFGGTRATATVHLEPFYDPRGERVRS